MLQGWGVSPSPPWITVGFALATHWWVAGMAGPHHFAQLAGVLFLLIALNLAVRGRWPMAAGLAVGLAAGSRLPMGLALPVVLGLYGGGWRPHRSWLPVVAGVAGALISRGTKSRASDRVESLRPACRPARPFRTDEHCSAGLLSVSYIPHHLK